MFLMSKRILSAALLIPVLLICALGTSFATWHCRYDGVTRTSCCCPVKADGANPAEPAHTAISKAGCCAVAHHEVDKAPSDRSPRINEVAPAAELAAPAALLPATVEIFPRRFAAHGARPDKPPSGRALVLRKHAFLI